jgi:death-on-curing protein
MTISYLSRNYLIELNRRAVEMVGGTNYGVQSEPALDVIVNQPAQVVFGQELYDTVWKKAAFLLQKITKKHVFVDGNKRTAVLAAFIFLHKNGYEPISADVLNNSEKFILAITNAPDSDATMMAIAQWLMDNFEAK